MTDTTDIVARLRDWADKDEIVGVRSTRRTVDLRAAADRIEALEAENAEALDILYEFKAEVAKLAETDPEISDDERKRLAHQGAAARYRQMALLSFRDSKAWAAKRKELEAEVVRLREHLSKAVLSEGIVMQMAGFTDPRNVSNADDELNLFAELIEEAKQIHGDLYEGAALEGQK